ncbi:MAG TPA: hydrolase TatD [Flavobacteriales bacterium]|nr:hydrolase TatD [Flavobacteriales bacterium]|tara:strand:+ start:3988 stop:4767 length:780 start_codon:yes stop_codon:yes gene_type:complete
MPLFDTHNHIFAEQFSKDIDNVIANAQTAGITKMVLPNIDKESVEPMLALHKKHPDLCLPAIGLHPTSVDDNFNDALTYFEQLLESLNHPFVGIGETGLDLYWDKTFLAQQIESLSIQVEWAKKYQLPIILHVRDAFDEIFEVIDRLHDEKLTGIFHCFTGNTSQAEHILDYKTFKIGIGGVVTFKNSGLDKVVKNIPLEQIVIETDAPYLAPTPYRGKRNEPAYLTYVVHKLAEIYELPFDTVAQKTFDNAMTVFKLK